MQVMFVIWIALVVAIARRTFAEGSVGLPAALVLTMSFLYGGCFVYAVPGYTHLRADGNPVLMRYAFSEWTVVQGTFASLLGILGFALGTGVFRRRYIAATGLSLASRSHERKMLLLLGGVGLLGFALHYSRLSFPMSSALHEAARNVGVVALCLGSYLSWRDGRRLLVWVVLSALVPLYYLVLFGFASYGFLFGIILLAFWLAKLRRQPTRGGLRTALLAFVTVWLVLTAFTGWFSFRDEIRGVIWSGDEGSLGEISGQAIAETELFSLTNFASLDLVNIRLNLPLFIGKMIENHSLYPDLAEYGATLVILPLVVVPRFIWLGKPARGGSDFMQEHSGIALSESATFGTGTVFEFYVNFGYVGVFIGFIVLGWLIRRVDRAAHRNFVRGNLFDFARLFVIGIVAIDPLLRPFFIVNGAVFAWLFMTALKLGFNKWVAIGRTQHWPLIADRPERKSRL